MASRLAESTEHHGLWAIWQTLAYVRRPIRPNLLSRVGGDGLTELQAAVLKECLLYPLADGQFVLHRTLQTDALGNPTTRERRTSANALLVEYYASRFADGVTRGNGSALLEEMEAFHHAVESGSQSALDRFRPFFVDALDGLGRRLSYEDHRYDAAAEVFRQSIVWDETDDYAHHYLAFNLDVQGTDPVQVESAYKTAIDLDPRVSLWWARYISFLIVRGRIPDAREAWTDATEMLFPAHAESGALFIYDHLHVWVAQKLLLHRGHLKFARDVLL